MNLPDEKIIAFIKRHHVLTLATSVDDMPWCSNIFYAYLPEHNLFVCTSEHHTKHATDVFKNSVVAGSIVLETKLVGKIQGLQIRGVMRPLNENERLRKAYLRRFPYSAVMQLELWALEPFYYKYTDNTLGFGKKIFWGNAEPSR